MPTDPKRMMRMSPPMSPCSDYRGRQCLQVKQTNEHMIQAGCVRESMQARQHCLQSQSSHLLVMLVWNATLLALEKQNSFGETGKRHTSLVSEKTGKKQMKGKS